ncbi:formate dehydrogenase [Roseivirga sp. 4D4]|uniref:(2Fe-2S) ferredoxin domain-containing protein n=1 Tax=Roseivirga sp. 4D4 TaxID=1889784 RepID=UPI0008535A43|nr:NADH-ubiquinone oxidoreductase-F iron-sulfur binding region domain-containing protein [Roseivirga sp. 4D4]OEK00675.1 formate dehydrogenase [Roseivirga sp. 4D4]
MSENLSALSGRKGLEDNLFEQLVEKSKVTGSPDNKELKALAEKYLMGNAITYGTASFYDFMKKEHEGVKVHVCNGSACMVAGTQDSVKGKLSRHFKDAEVGHMCCLGRCHENSAFNYNGTNYSGDAINHLEEIVKDTDKDLSDNYSVGATGERVLTGEAMTAQQFKDEFSKILANGPEWALEQIKASNIRGRGGAGFPMSFKLNACRNEPEPQKFIVCNADEGDPGAYSDRYLLEEQPMLVLFGMMTAGYIVGADHGAVYIRGEYPESVRACTEAVEALEAIDMHGDNIGGSDFNYRFKVIEGAGAYICGEETALLSSLEGQRPEVRVRPPFPAQKGLFNKPTIVNNVETLAAVPWIIRNGGDQYAKLGTEKSTGTKLVCLDSFFNKPGMYEVEMGHSFKDLVYETGGGFKEPVKAVHVGGPLGGIVPTHKIDDLNLDFESFANGGFLLGHAGIVSVPEKFPMIEYLEHLFEFTADESCGKCFPCSIGSVRGKEMIANSRNGEKMDRQLMDDLLETLEIGSLCALGGGLPLGIKNALQYFKEELRSYFL